MKLRKALSLFSAVLILTATFPFGGLTASADYDYGEISSCWVYLSDIVNNEAIICSIDQDPFHHDSGYIIRIPDTIDGYPVTGIRGRIGIVFDFKLLLPDTIKYFDLDEFSLDTYGWYNYYQGLNYIGSENNEYLVLAGSESKDITDIDFPDGVKVIANRAFYDCSSLKSITIPDGVTSIGSYAFHGCTNLESITIPDSVTSIGRSAFYGCDNLQYNTYGNGKYLGNDENNYLVLIDTESTNITDFTFADGVTFIGSSAFYRCESLTSIAIPDGVTSIDGAFYGCTNLKSVTIPNGVTSIGSYAFYGCTNLETVYYLGTQKEWYNISKEIFNDPLTRATLVLHTYGDDDRVWKTATEPTFTAEGLKQYICTVCGAVFESKTISKLIYGDADKDGKINSSDLVVLRKGLIGGMTDYSKNMSFDINGDEAINLLDLVRLKKYLADPEKVILGADNAGTGSAGDTETDPDSSGSGTGGNTTDPNENGSGEDTDTDADGSGSGTGEDTGTDPGGDVTDSGDDFTDSGNDSADLGGFGLEDDDDFFD